MGIGCLDNTRCFILDDHISLPVIKSSVNLFGGHLRKVEAGWSFQKEKHQTFELLYVLSGHQTTEIEDNPLMYGPGEMIILSPGTHHLNYNASSIESMTYFCFHFNIENLDIKSQIISNLSNHVIGNDTSLSKVVSRTVTDMISATQNKKISMAEKEVKIEISFLNFLVGLMDGSQNHDHYGYKYSVKEADVAQKIASLIERGINKKESVPLSVDYVCKKLNISTSYAHRVFKKVYGITPLRFIEEQQCRKAKMLLGLPDKSIEDIGYLVGFKNFPTFSRQFKKWTGVSPSGYRKFSIYSSSSNETSDDEFFM